MASLSIAALRFDPEELHHRLEVLVGKANNPETRTLAVNILIEYMDSLGLNYSSHLEAVAVEGPDSKSEICVGFRPLDKTGKMILRKLPGINYEDL